ncbi:hypothetical protein Barb6_00166 [Bacteroidales bacterium Barb6]|nr:hypothetical protein Barb6_00166 [Bacteroidales bacterium Barb6]
MEKKKSFTLIVSIVSIFISITAICTSLQSFSLDSSSYIGWIVAVLSTLVVVLIGWQIYTTIDAKEVLQKVSEIEKKVDYETDRANLNTCMALSDFYYRLGSKDIKNMEFKYLLYNVSSILHASKMRDIKTCNAVVKAVLEVIVSDKLVITEYDKKLIFDLITQVKYGNEIEQYGDLLQMLSSVKTQ